MMNCACMSWKRILKAARKLGTPVIITDESGKDPFVVMSLSRYEDLVEENELFTDMEIGEDGFEGNLDDDFDDEHDAWDHRLEKVMESQSEPETINFAEQTEKISENPVMEPLSEDQESPKTKQEMALEDRFYFEPLEDEFKK